MNPEGIYFITSTIVDWIDVFTSEKYYSIIIENLKFYQKQNGLKIFAYVILKNHIHLIVSNNNLSKIIQSFKKFTAREIIISLQKDSRLEILKKFEQLKKDYKITSNYQIWQEGFHPKEILTNEEMRQKVDYIHMNPIRKSYVENPEDWIYSSAGDYMMNRKGLINLDLDLF